MKEDDVQVAYKHLRPVPSPPDELEALFREHHEQVFRAAYRVTGNAVDAEDILQTVFLRIMRRRAGLDLSPSPGAYLHRAAINASLDLLRNRSRARSVSISDTEFDTLASPAANPETEHAGGELRVLVRKAVATLGPKAAEVCVLRYFEGYSNREIAEMLDTSQMVIAVILHRARARLRKEIGKFLEEHHETL